MWKKRPGRGESEREKFAREAMAHLDHLYRVAVYLAKDPDAAQDLVQETYARALGSHEQFGGGPHLKAWLTRILYNFFIDHVRRTGRWVSLQDQVLGPDEESDCREGIPAEDLGPETDILRLELSAKIHDALKQLPEEFRMPVVLVDMGDLSYAEAAEILSCPLGTVRSRLFRGRKLLHQKLQAYFGAKEKA